MTQYRNVTLYAMAYLRTEPTDAKVVDLLGLIDRDVWERFVARVRAIAAEPEFRNIDLSTSGGGGQ